MSIPSQRCYPIPQLDQPIVPALSHFCTTNTPATAIPVTPDTMNYASVVFAGFSLIAAIWYLVNARKHYQGPQISQVRRMSTDASHAH